MESSDTIAGSINHLERAMLCVSGAGPAGSEYTSCDEVGVEVDPSVEAYIDVDDDVDEDAGVTGAVTGPSSCKKARMSATDHWSIRLLPAAIADDIGHQCCSMNCTHRLTINGTQIIRTINAKMSPFDRRATAKADVQSFRVDRTVM